MNAELDQTSRQNSRDVSPRARRTRNKQVEQDLFVTGPKEAQP